jgi:two-component system OmpR family sensor kinase/two-component system sensor histidine kinase BaeS
LFWRFAATFGAIMFFVASGIAILALVFTRLLGGSTQIALLTWLGVCSLAIVLPMIGFGIASRFSRDITTPLADIMAAADRVAAGDLSIRVAENSPSQFGQLARIFNRMVEELQRIDEQRRNLTADVAHELRTPLHIIQGNLEGILDGVYQPTPEHIQMLLDETIILSRLVEDLRTLSLAESGHLPLHRQPVQVAELLADLVTSFSGQADAAGIRLQVETQRLAETTVDADILRLNQVLANLIVNALRYTPKGGKIMLRGESTLGGVRFMISDTGQGISPEDLPHIFDRFWRGDPARSHKDGAGGGLGLAIVRQLVELHGGHIAVQSAPGVGTTFTIDLPATAPPSEQSASYR